MCPISRAVDQHHPPWPLTAVSVSQAAQQAAEPIMRSLQRQAAERHGDNSAAALQPQEPPVEGGERQIDIYRPIDSTGALVDVLFREHRNMKAARAFFRSARAGNGVAPNRVTTDGHDSYPRAIRSELGRGVRHRTSRYLNNRLEQDHHGLKGRYRPMRGFKCPRSAARFCRGYDDSAISPASAPATTNTFPPPAAEYSSSAAP